MHPSADSDKDGLLYTSYNWPQVRTELVQNAIGPGQRASGAVVMAAGGLSVVSARRWRGLGSRDFFRLQLSPTCPSVPASSVPYFCSFGLRGWTGGFTWTSASSFFSCASACDAKYTKELRFFSLSAVNQSALYTKRLTKHTSNRSDCTVRRSAWIPHADTDTFTLNL